MIAPPPVVATSDGVDRTRALGEALARTLVAGDVIVLTGDLGAGKTALTQGLALGLGLDADEVTSPTFALVSEHRGVDGGLGLLHADVYRLDHASEITDLALAELVEEDHVVAVVEWGEKAIAAGALPEDRLDVLIVEGGGPDDRVLSLWLRGPGFEARRGRIMAAFAAVGADEDDA